MNFLGRLILTAVVVAGVSSWAQAARKERLKLEGNFTQGGLARGLVAPGSKVTFLGREVRVGDDGRFVIGFGRDFGKAASIKILLPNGHLLRREVAIKKRDYKIQRIDGLPKKMVTPGPKALKRIKRENLMISDVRRLNTPKAYFAEGFIWPAEGPISGVFGSQRVLNGEPRRPHYGVDVAGPAGTPVVAPASGIVALAEKDLYFTGGTVMIDHGHGLTSVYSHLSEVAVKVGALVKQGMRIGAIGATGRATGPHLDWRINWFNQRLDPALLPPPGPDNREANWFRSISKKKR